jgi:hypothetical protein
MIMTSQPFFSVQQVAEQLGLTDGRIRQICREYEIGVLLGRDRVLTAEDVNKIKNLPDRRKKITA